MYAMLNRKGMKNTTCESILFYMWLFLFFFFKMFLLKTIVQSFLVLYVNHSIV